MTGTYPLPPNPPSSSQSVLRAPAICPACRLPVEPDGSKCPHCGTYYGKHSIWGRADVYIPVLSLLIAFIALVPPTINAVSEALYPPVARVVPTHLYLDRPGLVLELANFGTASGVLSNNVVCTLSSAVPRVQIQFSSVSRPFPRVDEPVLAVYASDPVVRVGVAAFQQPNVVEDPPRPVRFRDYLSVDKLDVLSLGNGEKLSPGDTFRLECEIAVDGNNGPEAIRFDLSYLRIPDLPLSLRPGRPVVGPEGDLITVDMDPPSP